VTEIEKVNQAVDIQESDVVLAIRVAIAGMMDQIDQLAETGDWESLVRGLAPLRDVIGDLRIIQTKATNAIIDTMPERMVTVEGVGTVERLKKTTRKNWDSEELLRFVVRHALVDEETGEIPSSPMEAVDKVIREVRAVVPFTGSTGWRVGELKKRGIDPDEWCEQNTDGYSLKVTGMGGL
jgi:hypothetical protein